MWTKVWATWGRAGDKRWRTWENSGDVHTGPWGVHTGRTAPVDKKEAATWENIDLPSVHSPYYYYVLISE